MAKVPIRLLGERILVKRLEADATSGGIHLPESAQEKPQRGEVVAIGTGTSSDDEERTELDVKVGDVVIFAKYGGTDLKLDGEEYIVLDFDQVYAKEA